MLRLAGSTRGVWLKVKRCTPLPPEVSLLPQEKMIERLRQICEQDERLVAAMLYGSFAQQEADWFSDIDCALFFEDERLAEVKQKRWVGQIAPVELYYVNEFGNGVAIFGNLVRAEFHFDPVSSMRQVETWRGKASFPSVEAALLVDRSGELAEHLQVLVEPVPDRDTAEEVQFLCDSFLNWMLFGSNVLMRGEQARAAELLVLVHDYLLRMVRILEECTQHWITPTRAVEREISEESYQQLRACSASLEPEELRLAYLSAWKWGKGMMAEVGQRHALTRPDELIAKIEQHIDRLREW